MKKYNWIIYTAVFFMPMCVNWKITHMDSDDLAWMKTYEIGDVEYFLSNKGNIDILLVREKGTWNKFKILRENEGFDEYIAGGYISYILYHKNDTIEGNWGITKEKQNEPVFIWCTLGDRCNKYTYNHTSYGVEEMFFHISPPIQSVIINGTKVTDCVVIDDTNSDWGKYQIEYGVTGFVWSKSKGLLQYSFLGGEVFTRIEFTDLGKKMGLKQKQACSKSREVKCGVK